MVASEHCGSYRQVAGKLRFQRGPGRPDKVSERPRDPRTRAYTDDDAPTIVTLDEHDVADVPALLALGTLMRLPDAGPAAEISEADAPVRPRRAKVATDG